MYLVTLMPTLSAAMRLSRAAMMARPVRLFTRLKITTRATSTSTKPAAKVEMVWECITPMGPLMSSTPPSPSWLLLLRKENCRPLSSFPR